MTAAPDMLSPLAQAARDGDVAEVKRLVANGHDADDGGGGPSPLWEACASEAPAPARLAIAEALLAAGADARKAVPEQRPLHAAAQSGPVALVDLLLAHGAIEWEPNVAGKSALDIARESSAADAAAVVDILDRPVIRDAGFRAAVDAIHAGNVAELQRLLDAGPRLLTERIREPECYRLSQRDQYFRDPKLIWFIANNPTLTDTMAANMADVARAMIRRGVTQADLDTTLGLVMTSSSARENGLQLVLVDVLVDAGAKASPQDMHGVLGHCETEAVEHLIAGGMALTAPIAAALDRRDVLPELLSAATQADIDAALDLAVINNRTEAARLALQAGANPDRFSSQHGHSQPLHQAALHDNIALLDMLVAAGARVDAVDTLWGGTPLGWARHGGNAAAIAWLEGRMRR